MKPSVVKTTVKHFIRKRVNIFLAGPPGVGKSTVPIQACQEEGWTLIHIHGPTVQPEDLALPAVDGDRLKFKIADWVPIEGDPRYADDEIIVILIDEGGAMDKAMQKSFANMVQARECHGYKLHPGVRFVMTGNRATDGAGSALLLTHFADRFTRIEFEADLDDWTVWAITNNVDPTVISFLRFKTAAFCPPVDKTQPVNATPRGWSERVSGVIDGLPQEAVFEAIKGAVGDGFASEYLAHREIAMKLPNPDAILANPDSYAVPEDMSTLYALSGALAHRASPDNFDRIMAFARRMPAEFTVLIVRDSVNRCGRKLERTKAYLDWAAEEGCDALMP